MIEIPEFIEFIFTPAPSRLHLYCHFKLLHTMGIVSTTQGGGKYSAPMIETIEVAAEIGFAVSGNVPSSDGISPLGYYDDFYLSENE